MRKIGPWLAAAAVVIGLALIIGSSLWPSSPAQETVNPTMTEPATPPASVPTPTQTKGGVTFATCDVDKMSIPDLPLKKGERNKWDIIPLTPQQDATGNIPLPPADSSLSDPHPPAALVSGYTVKYHQAGPKADDMVAIIGHSSPWRVLPFNSLMNQGKQGGEAPRVKVGQRVYLHTTCSGKWWLEYEVGDAFTAGKPAFASDPRIFGTEKMPGWLALITCLQPKEGHSTQVVAITGQLKGVVSLP